MFAIPNPIMTPSTPSVPKLRTVANILAELLKILPFAVAPFIKVLFTKEEVKCNGVAAMLNQRVKLSKSVRLPPWFPIDKKISCK